MVDRHVSLQSSAEICGRLEVVVSMARPILERLMHIFSLGFITLFKAK